MPHPLNQKMQLIGRRCERLLFCYAVSGFLVVAISAAFTVGFADYLIRFEDRGVRSIASSLWVAALVAGYVRFLHPVIRYRLTDLEVARPRRAPLSAVARLSLQRRGISRSIDRRSWIAGIT